MDDVKDCKCIYIYIHTFTCIVVKCDEGQKTWPANIPVSCRFTLYMAARMRVAASSTRCGCWEVLDGLRNSSVACPGISWSKPWTKEGSWTAHQSDWTKPWKPSSPFLASWWVGHGKSSTFWGATNMPLEGSMCLALMSITVQSEEYGCD